MSSRLASCLGLALGLVTVAARAEGPGPEQALKQLEKAWKSASAKAIAACYGEERGAAFRAYADAAARTTQAKKTLAAALDAAFGKKAVELLGEDEASLRKRFTTLKGLKPLAQSKDGKLVRLLVEVTDGEGTRESEYVAFEEKGSWCVHPAGMTVESAKQKAEQLAELAKRYGELADAVKQKKHKDRAESEAAAKAAWEDLFLEKPVVIVPKRKGAEDAKALMKAVEKLLLELLELERAGKSAELDARLSALVAKDPKALFAKSFKKPDDIVRFHENGRAFVAEAVKTAVKNGHLEPGTIPDIILTIEYKPLPGVKVIQAWLAPPKNPSSREVTKAGELVLIDGAWYALGDASSQVK